MASASILAAWSSSAGLPEPGICGDGQFDDRGGMVADADEGVQNGVADAAFKPVVFDDDQLAAAVLRGPVQGLFVNRLDRVGVNQADR